MAKKYSKTKLKKFQKLIEEKMGYVHNEVETIKEGVSTATNKQGGLIVTIWRMQELIPMSRKKTLCL